MDYTIKLGVEKYFLGSNGFFKTNTEYPFSINAKDDADAFRKAVVKANYVGNSLLGFPGIGNVNVKLLDINNGKSSVNQKMYLSNGLSLDSEIRKLTPSMTMKEDYLEMNYSIEKRVRLMSNGF